MDGVDEVGRERRGGRGGDVGPFKLELQVQLRSKAVNGERGTRVNS